MAQSLLLDTASGWELATKVSLGKLPGAEGLLQDLPSLLHQQGFQPLAMQLHHGVHAGGYRQAHRDPFDRLLAAQAELEGLHLVSLDPALATFPLPPAGAAFALCHPSGGSAPGMSRYQPPELLRPVTS